MHAPDALMEMQTISEGITFEVELDRRCINVQFRLQFSDSDEISDSYRKLINGYSASREEDSDQKEGTEFERTETYRFKIRFEHIKTMLEQKGAEESRTFVIPLETPPEVYRKIHDTIKSFTDDKERRWSEWDTWLRQTDITHLKEALAKLPLTLNNPYAAINIGECFSS